MIVGEGDTQKEYECHAAVLAMQSTFIDAMLASPMKESSDRVLRFPDLEPSTWEAMIKFLKPLEFVEMNTEHALTVVAAYDKYDFVTGRECCDVVFSRIFDGVKVNAKPQNDLDSLIETYVLAHEKTLPKTREKARQYFGGCLQSSEQYGRLMFSEDHITKLAPLMEKDSLVKETFPKLFVDSASNCYLYKELEAAVCKIKVSGKLHASIPGYGPWLFSRSRAGGDKFCLRTMGYNISIERTRDGWILRWELGIRLQTQTWWKCPYSAHRKVLPPKEGWESAGGESIKIEYVYGGNS